MMLANPTRQMFAQQTTAEMDGAGGIDHHHQHPLLNTQRPPHPHRKRKAETQPENNERLSKRMSLLNLEQGGTKLYVPVENPLTATASPTSPSPSPTSYPPPRQNDSSDTMQLDDSKYKVYIYNMEDELSSESEAEPDDNGKLVFLPDIEKHLRTNRILPAYMLNKGPGGPDPVDLAQMQLVLYNVPSSISVPEEQDSVRKAIMEARARMREKLGAEKREEEQTVGLVPEQQQTQPVVLPPTNGFQSCAPGGDDPDAMELD